MLSRVVAYSFVSLSLFACGAPEAPQDGAVDGAAALTAFAPAQCLFGATKQDLLSSPALTVGGAVRYTAQSELSPALSAQLAQGVEGFDSAEALFEFVQDGELFQQEVRETGTGRSFTLTTYWAGDNPHGFVQLGTVRVATIQDDSVYHCLVSAQRAPSVSERCAFGDDVSDFTLSDRFTVTSSAALTARSKLPALGELQVRLLGDGVVSAAREVFASVDDGQITRFYATDRATNLRYALYTAKRHGELLGVVFGYGTLDVLGRLVAGERGFQGCLAPTPRNCTPDEVQLEPASYSAALEEAMQNAYSECRYCTGLEVRAFDVLCPGAVDDAVVSILNDETQGRPGYDAAAEITSAQALATLDSSGIQSLDAAFRTALGEAADIRWFFSSGRYDATAPGVDGAEKLIIASSASAARAVSVTVRDEYP